MLKITLLALAAFAALVGFTGTATAGAAMHGFTGWFADDNTWMTQAEGRATYATLAELADIRLAAEHALQRSHTPPLATPGLKRYHRNTLTLRLHLARQAVARLPETGQRMARTPLRRAEVALNDLSAHHARAA